MYLDSILAKKGPDLPEIHYEEMTKEELEIANAYLYGAVFHATEEGLDAIVLEILTQWYDEVFLTLACAYEPFRERFLDGRIIPPGGPTDRPKYLAMIKAASES